MQLVKSGSSPVRSTRFRCRKAQKHANPYWAAFIYHEPVSQSNNLIHLIKVFNGFIMEEQEVPTEGLSEQINDQAEKETAAEEKKWSFYIAISTALIAVLAAISSLIA